MQTYDPLQKITPKSVLNANAKTTTNPLKLSSIGEENDVLQEKQNPLRAIAYTNNPLQFKRSDTGLPDNLKMGVEAISGYNMDDVKVHYNSGKPAQLQALAYAQGTDIHVGPGQEQHLPHEAWHVVQQKQGRVQPTLQMKGGIPVSDDTGLEQEADIMGERASNESWSSQNKVLQDKTSRQVYDSGEKPVQRKIFLRTGQNVVKCDFDQISNWLKIASYNVKSKEAVEAYTNLNLMVAEDKDYIYDQAFGQRDLISFLSNKENGVFG